MEPGSVSRPLSFAARATAFAALLLVAFASFQARADAQGELNFAGCVSNDGSAGACADAPGTALGNASALAISPDGATVYVGADNASDSIYWFNAASAGQLTFAGCVSNDGSGGTCTDLPGAPLSGIASLAVSPDGDSVYSAAGTGDTVTHFTRAASGALSFGGCVSNQGENACTDVPGTPLDNPLGIAVSPNGGSVYVASLLSDSVTHFDAAPAGQLTFSDCHSNSGSGSCTGFFVGPLAGAIGVAVAPDASAVFVSASTADSVSRFTTDAAGDLEFADCASQDGLLGVCSNVPGSAFDGPGTLATSADGDSLYVPLAASDAVAHFTLGVGGQMTSAGCVSDTGSGGTCTDVTGSPLNGAAAVATSPDGDSVYVAASDANSLSHFTAAPQGQLTFENCFDNNGANCADIPGAAFDNVRRVAVRPDGASVYATAQNSASINHFGRVLPNRDLSFAQSGTGSGIMRAAAQGLECDTPCTNPVTWGTNVTLTAQPYPGSGFVGWSGAGCSGKGSCTFSLRANTTVTARFDTIPDTVIKKAKVRGSKAKFTFSSDVAGVDFECAVAKKRKDPKYKGCSSPQKYKKLKRGKYLFYARAISDAGTDESPAKKRFKIK